MRYFPLRELGYAFGFLVILLALYVGAYYALIDAKKLHWDSGHGPSFDMVVYEYRFADEWSQSFFRPIQSIDLPLRFPEKGIRIVPNKEKIVESF